MLHFVNYAEFAGEADHSSRARPLAARAVVHAGGRAAGTGVDIDRIGTLASLRLD